MGEKMERATGTGEVEFEEVKKAGFLERFRLFFRRKNKKQVPEQPEIVVLPVEPGVAGSGIVRSAGVKPAETGPGIGEPEVVKPAVLKPVETGAMPAGSEMLKPAGVKPMEAERSPEDVPPEPTTPMVKVLPKEEDQSVGDEKGLVEMIKPVKLEKSILGFEEEKQIVKLENRLRKTRLLFEKKLKETVEDLERRKGEIEQTMILESQSRREAELSRKEEMLNKKEKEIDAVIRTHQLEREDELNRRERELIIKEKEIGERAEEKIDEEVKKLLVVIDELLGKLPKEVIDEFVKSEEYKLYEKVLDRYGV